MSIQSEITRIEQEVNNQENLINQISEILESKSLPSAPSLSEVTFGTTDWSGFSAISGTENLYVFNHIGASLNGKLKSITVKCNAAVTTNFAIAHMSGGVVSSVDNISIKTKIGENTYVNGVDFVYNGEIKKGDLIGYARTVNLQPYYGTSATEWCYKTASLTDYTLSQKSYGFAISAVVEAEAVVADVSNDTVTPDTLLHGNTAHNAQGESIEGAVKLKKYESEVVSTVSGSGKYVVLAKDDWLAEHRTDETLFVRTEFVPERVAYTVVKAWAQNKVHLFPYDTTMSHQVFLRYNQNVLESYNYAEYKIHDNTTLTSGIGRLYITEDGELRCYSNSNNYAIRPGKYVVKIEW